MPQETFVPAEAFLAVTKTMLTLIHEMSVGLQVMRLALMTAESLPVSSDYLKTLDAKIRDLPELKEVQAAIARMDSTAELGALLKQFEGPVQ